MRIVRVRVSTVANDLGGRVWNPQIRWTIKHAVFVELVADDGRVGLGECWCFDAAHAPLVAFLETELVPHLLGATLADVPDRLAVLWRRATLTARHGLLASAASGVDIALWDLRARAAGLPLWRLLDANGPGVVRLYASGGLYAPGKRPAELGRELAAYAAQGFDVVKMKVGGAPLDEDVARVAAARHALGPDRGLVVDGVYSYTPETAAALFARLRPCDVRAFQSPVPAADLDGMRRLTAAGVPVMGLEAEYRDEVFAALIEGGAVATLQVAPIACGGITRVRALAGRAAAKGLAVSLEVSSTAVATLVAAHLAAADGRLRDVEWHRLHRVFFDVLEAPPFAPAAAVWRLPETPGLGIDLEPGRVNLVLDMAA